MEGSNPSVTQLLGRKEQYIERMLSRFRDLVTLAAKAPGDGTSKEVAAAHALLMKNAELDLVGAAEDLLKLTRELKELWLAGPLREIGQGEAETKMEDDAKATTELIDGLLRGAVLPYGEDVPMKKA